MPRLTAPETAKRLGVKVETVYSYVSRGVLSAEQQPGARRSTFDPVEVEELARRGRPRRSSRPAALDLVVETELTTIVAQRPRYRGVDACELARTSPFEAVARSLWLGVDADSFTPWQPYPVELPGTLTEARDRMRATVVFASAAETHRAELSPSLVVAHAQRLIASLASSLATSQPGVVPHLDLARGSAPIPDSLAGRLWASIAGPHRAPGMVTALNGALVLLADHELSSSTMTARVAASTRADPFSVVLAGLGAIAGPLHAGASSVVHAMILDAQAHGVEAALRATMGRRGPLPGFGHPLYPEGDPRAAVLLDLLAEATPDALVLRVARELAAAVDRRTHLPPNIDFALGVFSTLAKLPATAGETVFTIARTAGWIAHALEEYAERPLRFRARAHPRTPNHS